LLGIREATMGRLVARIAAVLAVGLGAGLLAWGLMAGLIKEPFRPPFGWESLFGTPGKIVGWGAGFLAAGVTTLILSFLEDDRGESWEE
jgi:hypothetical protein